MDAPPYPQGAKAPVGAYVICKNEADVIAGCLLSLSACREIIVVDSGSTDATLAIVEGFERAGWPVRLLHNAWPGYAAQKQFALERVKEEWALCLDADERLDPELSASLAALAQGAGDVAAFRLRRRLWLHRYGWAHPGTRLGSLVRLTRRGRARYDPGTLVHEHIHVDGPVRDVRRGAILHRRSLPVEEQIVKENRYAALKAEQLARAGKGPRVGKLVANPPYHFLRRYLGQRYVLSGWAGFIHSAMGAIYAFQTEAILYEKRRAGVDAGRG